MYALPPRKNCSFSIIIWYVLLGGNYPKRLHAEFVAHNQATRECCAVTEIINDLLCIGTCSGCKNGDVDSLGFSAESAAICFASLLHYLFVLYYLLTWIHQYLQLLFLLIPLANIFFSYFRRRKSVQRNGNQRGSWYPNNGTAYFQQPIGYWIMFNLHQVVVAG